MKTIYNLIKGTFLLLLVPIQISKGQRRRAMLRVARVYASAKLF